MKYEFASAGWLGALHGIIVERAAWEIKTKPNLQWSICEVYLNVPAHLAQGDRKIAWSCVIDGANVDFRLEERDDVSFKAVVDYDAVVPVGRVVAGDDPERAAQLSAMAAALVEGGHMTTTGAMESGPEAITSVHDMIARLTR